MFRNLEISDFLSWLLVTSVLTWAKNGRNIFEVILDELSNDFFSFIFLQCASGAELEGRRVKPPVRCGWRLAPAWCGLTRAPTGSGPTSHRRGGGAGGGHPPPSPEISKTKQRSEKRQTAFESLGEGLKVYRKYSSFFAKVKNDVTRGHQRSNFTVVPLRPTFPDKWRRSSWTIRVRSP